MNLVLGAVAVTLVVITAWGFIAPRQMWRVLGAWSVSDPHKSEPGGGAYGVRRFVFGIGLLGVLAVLLGLGASFINALPREGRALSDVEQMWGQPTPDMINRVVTPAAEVPGWFAPMPVLGYQEVGEFGPARYLNELRVFSLLGQEWVPGLIGSDPDPDYSAVDTAELVIEARGPVLCIPRAATVIETAEVVQVAVYYGLPDHTDPADESPIDHLAGCSPDDTLTSSVLIPLELAEPLGNRTVQLLDGTAVPEVPDTTDD